MVTNLEPTYLKSVFISSIISYVHWHYVFKAFLFCLVKAKSCKQILHCTTFIPIYIWTYFYNLSKSLKFSSLRSKKKPYNMFYYQYEWLIHWLFFYTCIVIFINHFQHISSELRKILNLINSTLKFNSFLILFLFNIYHALMMRISLTLYDNQ